MENTTAPKARITPIVCLGIYAIVWGFMAYHPVYPDDWLLENILAVLGVAFFVVTCGIQEEAGE